MNRSVKWAVIFLGSLGILFVVANVVSVLDSRFWVKAKDCNPATIEIDNPVSPVWQNSRGWAFDGTHLWIMVSSADKIIKINPVTRATVGVVMLPSQPFDLTFDGTHIWVSSTQHYYVIDINTSTFEQLPVTSEKGQQLTSGAGTLVFDGKYLWSNAYGVSQICRETGEFITSNLSGTGSVGVYDGQFLWGVSQEGLIQIDAATGSVVADHILDVSRSLYYDGESIWGIVTEGGVPNEYGGIHYTDDNFETFLAKINISQLALPYVAAKYELESTWIKDITSVSGLIWMMSDTGKVMTFDPASKQITESRQVFNRMMGDFSLATDGTTVFAVDYSSGTFISLSDWPQLAK